MAELEVRDSGLMSVPTSEFEELAADSLVLALGQETDLSLVEDVPGIDIAEGVVQVGLNVMTGHPGGRGHGGRRYPRLHQ
jgi:hypothetical protein